MVGAVLRTRILTGFDDPTITAAHWNQLLRRGDTDAVNITFEWQRSWWNNFGRGKLLLIAVEADEKLIAIAPLFYDEGMIFNLCPEDRLDFVGDVSEPGVLEAILETAREAIAHFVGFQFYFIPSTSGTSQLLITATGKMGLSCHLMDQQPSPFIDIKRKPDEIVACTKKESLVRHENRMRREGALEVRHARTAAEILPQLDEFFDQHIARRAATDHPSLFVDLRQRDYYRRMTSEISPTGWLRFTSLRWNGRPIAFHYGLSYQGRYLYGIPSFDIRLSRYSPGEVLLRQLFFAAIEEAATSFDFGIGDESYKYRFATDTVQLQTFGLFPVTGGDAR